MTLITTLNESLADPRDMFAAHTMFRREFGMDRRDIADAAGWAAEAVLDSIRDRVAPYTGAPATGGTQARSRS